MGIERSEKLTIVLRAVLRECDRARAKHGPFHSTHEAYAVILEELQEWWDSVKADQPDDAELLSVAAMAILGLVELGGNNINNEYILRSLDEDGGAGSPSET
jgi:hypothetical protein